MPSLSEEPSNPLGMFAFLPFISRCAGHTNYMARFMAAKGLDCSLLVVCLILLLLSAIVSMVPSNQLAEFVPKLIRSLSARSDSSVSHNLAHGILLQVERLLNRELCRL